MKPIAIIGVGNLLMGDEGIGVHAIKYLEQFNWPEDIELIDAGVPGLSLLHIIEGRKLSVIIDCADFGGKSGDVLTVDAKNLKKPDEEMISLHGTSLLGTLSLAELTGIKTGRIVIICVQPENIAMTEALSDTVRNSLPDIKKAIEKLFD